MLYELKQLDISNSEECLDINQSEETDAKLEGSRSIASTVKGKDTHKLDWKPPRAISVAGQGISGWAHLEGYI